MKQLEWMLRIYLAIALLAALLVCLPLYLVCEFTHRLLDDRRHRGACAMPWYTP